VLTVNDAPVCEAAAGPHGRKECAVDLEGLDKAAVVVTGRGQPQQALQGSLAAELCQQPHAGAAHALYLQPTAVIGRPVTAVQVFSQAAAAAAGAGAATTEANQALAIHLTKRRPRKNQRHFRWAPRRKGTTHTPCRWSAESANGTASLAPHGDC
jgi:hypothetical protein